MSVSLDLTTQSLRSLRMDGDCLVMRQCRAAFGIVPQTPEYLELMRRDGIPHALCDDAVVLLGNEAAELTEAFQGTCRELLPQGRLPAGRPIARQALAALLDGLLPEPRFAGEICGVARSGIRPKGRSLDIDPLCPGTFTEQILRLRGYAPVALSRSLAAVYATGDADGMTAVGLELEANRCELSLVERGYEVARFSAATTVSLPLEIVRPLVAWQSPDAATICRSIVEPAISSIATHLSREQFRGVMPNSVTCYVIGELATIPDVFARVNSLLRSPGFPVQFGLIQMADRVEQACAHGALRYAHMMEQQAIATRTKAA